MDTTLSSRITRPHQHDGELLSPLTALCLAGHQGSEIVAHVSGIGSGGHVRVVTSIPDPFGFESHGSNFRCFPAPSMATPIKQT